MSAKSSRFGVAKRTKKISVTMFTALSLGMLTSASAEAQNVEPYGGLSLKLTPSAWLSALEVISSCKTSGSPST